MLDGAARVTELVERACELDMPALAVTDHGYMYGAVDFYRKAIEADLKPIIGCEVYFVPHSRLKRDGKPQLNHLLLLAKNDEGYRNLRALVSDAATDGFYYKPQVDLELLERYSEGLIAHERVHERHREQVDRDGVTRRSSEVGARPTPRSSRLGDFYIEIQNQGITADNGVTQSAAQRGARLPRARAESRRSLPPTTSTIWASEDAEKQDLLLCIGTGSTLDDAGSHEVQLRRVLHEDA